MEIVKFDNLPKGGKGVQASYDGLPFGALIEPNTGFHVPEGTVSGLNNAVKRFAKSIIGVKEETAEVKALASCYRVVDPNNDDTPEADRVPLIVVLRKHRPDVPASQVAAIMAEREAEAQGLEKVKRARTVTGLEKVIAAAQAKIAELTAESETANDN